MPERQRDSCMMFRDWLAVLAGPALDDVARKFLRGFS
jgi:hypothetical protein